MEKVTGPNRAVLQPVQHWPYYPAGPLGAALRTGRRIGQRSGRRWPSGLLRGYQPITAMVRRDQGHGDRSDRHDSELPAAVVDNVLGRPAAGP